MRTIEYVIEPSATGERFMGAVVDISKSGFCILTSGPLTQDQRIKISDTTLNEAKHPAIVRWTEKYNDLYYKY